MSKISLCYAYYNNAEMLQAHFAEWSHYRAIDKEQLEVVIVDDGSQATPIINTQIRDVGMPVHVFRVLQDIPWNQDGARNLAMLHAKSDWCLMMDMDHMLPRHQAAIMLEYPAQFGTYYMPNQRLVSGVSLDRPHPNGYLFARRDFWHMGGYDEDFAGWYGSDGNFRKCARGAGLVEKPIMDFYTTVYRDTDIWDANTKLGRKASQYDATSNPVLNGKRKGPAYRAINPIRFSWQRIQ